MQAPKTTLSPESRLLEKWARKHHDALLHYFNRRVSPPEQAEDLVQEVLSALPGGPTSKPSTRRNATFFELQRVS